MHFPEVNPVWLLTGEGEMLIMKTENDVIDPIFKESDPVYGHLSKEQHLEIVNSLKQVISALEGQLEQKERIIQLKDRIIKDLEAKS
ncbi:hypothetical protein [Belliella pelovolcani]|uniref:Uncharacterized protein n=1 Tax=Belliella pelovolcani TaxID=529505 RepID=A0A1N7M9S2_9BACT|nr:hypothetical protein [Belliella pelovolcani]SIS82711.1 hypothetical protein SAMN05421761_105217 [Belliella pelovolcani]